MSSNRSSTTGIAFSLGCVSLISATASLSSELHQQLRAFFNETIVDNIMVGIYAVGLTSGMIGLYCLNRNHGQQEERHLNVPESVSSHSDQQTPSQLSPKRQTLKAVVQEPRDEKRTKRRRFKTVYTQPQSEPVPLTTSSQPEDIARSPAELAMLRGEMMTLPELVPSRSYRMS